MNAGPGKETCMIYNIAKLVFSPQNSDFLRLFIIYYSKVIYYSTVIQTTQCSMGMAMLPLNAIGKYSATERTVISLLCNPSDHKL